MCVWVPVAIAAASAIVSTISAYNEAKSGNAALEYNAQASLNNAQMARYEGQYAQAQASRNATEKRRETGQLIGAQRARMGASGAVVDSGSFMDVTMNTAAGGEREAMSLLQQGDMEAWRKNVQAGQYEGQAEQYLASRKDVQGVVLGSMLSGAAKVGMSYFGASQFAGGGGGSETLFTAPPDGSAGGSLVPFTPLSS
jgi:hypothetical protein